MLRMCGLLVIAGAFALAQESNPFAADPKSAEIGRAMFRIYCAPCHGIRAQGGRGPDLTRGVFSSGEHDGGLYRTILNGVPGTEMGAYSELGADSVWRIVAYIRSATRAGATGPVPGDPARGKRLFHDKGQCGHCHAAGPSEGGVGPDLTRVGRQRSVEYLKTKLLDPSADITPGYDTLTVVTAGGTTIKGVEKGLDNFSGQLLDLSGKFYSFQRDEVRSMKRDIHSLMPPYSGVFSAAELTDLIAYLASLRGQEVNP